MMKKRIVDTKRQYGEKQDKKKEIHIVRDEDYSNSEDGEDSEYSDHESDFI